MLPGFFHPLSYNKNLQTDLEQFQIYKKAVDYTDNCFVYALIQSGVLNEEQITRLKSDLSFFFFGAPFQTIAILRQGRIPDCSHGFRGRLTKSVPGFTFGD